jgi:hypothetical protein
VAELGLVEVTRGKPVGLEYRLTVEGPPLLVAGAGHVGDDHVRVKVRVLRAARPMLVGGGDEAFAALADHAVLPAAESAGLVLEVGERGLPR